jgi:hypothetical protein
MALKIPGFLIKQFIGEIAEKADIPETWKPSCKEARCCIQLTEWFVKRIPELDALTPIARATAYRCDVDLDKRKEIRQGLIDLYMLLDSYQVDKP